MTDYAARYNDLCNNPSAMKTLRNAIARSVPQQDVEDVLQEALLRGWKALHTFKGNSALLTWLYRVCMNQAANYHVYAARRGKYKTVSINGLLSGGPAWTENTSGDADWLLYEGAILDFSHLATVEGEDPMAKVSDQKVLQSVVDLWQTLDPEWQVVFETTVTGLSDAETAELLGIAEGTVKSRKFRIRTMLREKFAEAE